MTAAIVAIGIGTLLLAGIGFAGFLWAWRTGQFSAAEENARIVFNDEEFSDEEDWAEEEKKAG